MKKLIGIILSVCMILSVCTVPVLAEDTIKVTIDGKVIDCAAYGQDPVAIDGTTLVPLRSVFEALGADVKWDDDTKTVISFREDLSILLVLNSTEMIVSGEVKLLSVPAQSMNDRIMVPIRAIAEAFGCDVKWDGDTRTVVISTVVDFEESPEDVVKKVYEALFEFDLEEVAKYCTGQAAVDLEEMDKYFDSADVYTFDIFTRSLLKLYKYEIIDVEINGDTAFVNTMIFAPNMDNMDYDVAFTSEEAEGKMKEIFASYGYTVEEAENITDIEIQNKIVRDWYTWYIDSLIKYVEENIDGLGYHGEESPCTLQKIDGRWLIVE